MIRNILLCMAIVAAPLASADMYKCVGKDGKLSFADTPCPPEQGTATFRAATQATNLDDSQIAERSAAVVRSNNGAAQIMEQQRAAKTQRVGPSLTIVADHTSTMAAEQRARDARALQDERIRQGLEPPRKVPVTVTCNRAGNMSFCDGSDGSSSQTLNYGGSSSTTVYPGQ